MSNFYQTTFVHNDPGVSGYTQYQIDHNLDSINLGYGVSTDYDSEDVDSEILPLEAFSGVYPGGTTISGLVVGYETSIVDSNSINLDLYRFKEGTSVNVTVSIYAVEE